MASGTPWHGVELRHFTALEAIARERSFSAAAFSLGYTQSAISAQVTALERAVGATLFERLPGSRGVELTAEGRVLLDHVSSILARLRTAQDDLDSLRTGAPPRLRVGTFQSVSMTMLPEVLCALDTVPELREVQSVNGLLELLERGELDVTFAVLPLGPGPYEAVELLRDPYVLVVHLDHPAALLDAPVSIEALGELPLITLERCLPQQLAEDALRAAGVTPNIVTRLEDFTSIFALAQAKLGFGLVSSLVAPHARDLVALPIDQRLPPRIIGVAWHRDRLRAGAVDAFIAAARTAAARFDVSAPLAVAARR
jgi:DNA-binding transcriptional LysR family regulator